MSALVAAYLAPGERAEVNAQAARVDPTGATQFRYQRGSGQWGFGSVSGAWSPDWQVQAAEFNGDGRTDFFLYNPTTGQWFRAVNDGAGGFTYFSGQWDPDWAVTILDLNGDGASDVFVYNRATGRWARAVYAGLTADFVYAAGDWLPGWSLFPAEWNRDAKADLLLYNASDGQWVRATNDGVAGFTYQNGVWTIGWTVGIGDFDGDRATDVFLYNQTNGVWYIARTIDVAWAYATGTWSPEWDVKVADLNADSRADVFVYNARTGEWVEAINSNAGAGGFTYFSGRWDPGWSVNAYDFNGDKRTDILLYARDTGTYVLCTNDGAGAFTFTVGNWGPGFDVVVPQITLPPPPPPPNSAPRIVSLTSSASRAEPDATVTLTTVIEDTETAVDQLTYEWTVETGSISGTGSRVTWRIGSIPSRSGPAATLTVVERYSALNADGTTAVREYRVSSSVRVAAGELSDLALSFLQDFADSTISPETCVRNFSDSCAGKFEELQDIRDNRATYVILSSTISVSRVTIDASRLNAEISVPCAFTSRIRATGQIESVRGQCYLTAVREAAWRLCDSRFFGSATSVGRFMR